jgi:multiple antibiotic resistance protein
VSLLSAAVIIFLVLDPMGNIPLFLSSLRNADPKRHMGIILRESLIGLGFLILFLFAGRYILVILHVTQSSLSVAGGIVLFLIAIKMIFAETGDMFGIGSEGEPLVVPLAVPLIAGPSAMTTVMLFMAKEPSRWPVWLAALVMAWMASSAILMMSKPLSRVLGKKGLSAMERLMGMILVTVSVEMFISGIGQAF